MTLLVPPSADIPLPVPSALSQPFWDACDLEQLCHQRCRNCGRSAFPPAYACRFCRRADLEWERSAGAGSIYSWSVVWRPQTPAFPTPYAPAIVELDERYLMLSCVVGCDVAEVRVGLRVRAVFHRIGARAIPYFSPAGHAAHPSEDRR